MRFWLHADGRSTPSFNAETGFVNGVAQDGSLEEYSSNLASVVSLAARHRLVLQLCLWSFDMCNSECEGWVCPQSPPVTFALCSHPHPVNTGAASTRS